MITGTPRWAHARKRYKAGTTFDIGYSQAVVQTGIISMSPFASLDVTHLLISLQSGAVFMAVSYELPEQCEHVVTRFPLVCTHLTLTPLCQSGSRHHFQWVRALPF
jgi:hypothetical protein